MALVYSDRWIFNGTHLVKRGWSNRLASWGDPFVLGVTDPYLNPNMVGAGFLRPITNLTPLTHASGTITVGDGETLVDRIINARVDIVGTGALENCIVRGPADGSSGTQRPLVQTTTATPRDPDPDGPNSSFNVRFCTISPQTPSPWMSGVGPKYYHMRRNLIENIVDGLASFSQTIDGLVRSYDEGSLIRTMVQFRPDDANSRPSTHNDGEQLQGNKGDRFDIYRRGTSYSGRLSTVYGFQPMYEPREHHSCVGLNVNTQTSVNGTWDGCFFRGGLRGMNGGGITATGPSHIVLSNCMFERPGTDPLAPPVAATINASIDRTGCADNFYFDNGAPVSIGFN